MYVLSIHQVGFFSDHEGVEEDDYQEYLDLAGESKVSCSTTGLFDSIHFTR
jgi:hypothetical protein